MRLDDNKEEAYKNDYEKQQCRYYMNQFHVQITRKHYQNSNYF